MSSAVLIQQWVMSRQAHRQWVTAYNTLCTRVVWYMLTIFPLILEMWANAQRDGRPAEYRWCPPFNTTKFGWHPLLECRAVMLPKHDTRWNFLGCPKLVNRCQALVGQSSPYCGDMWRRYCCLTSFSPIVDTCLSCKDIARQSCAMVPRWRIFGNFLHPAFQRAACSTFQTCILNSH